jgi:hypothetical protein
MLLRSRLFLPCLAAVNSTTSSDRITLYHRQHAKRQRIKAFSHLVPAVVLLSSVLGLFGGEPFTWVLGAEIVVGAAYLVLLTREMLHLQQHPHHRERVAWLEVASAGILALEGYHIWHRHHEAQLAGAPERFHILPWLYCALAVFYVFLAFQMQRLDARRFLHLHIEGLDLRIKPFNRAIQLRWSDIVSVEPIGDADLFIWHHDGRKQRISFAQMHDGTALRDKVVAHAQQSGR